MRAIVGLIPPQEKHLQLFSALRSPMRQMIVWDLISPQEKHLQLFSALRSPVRQMIVWDSFWLT